MMLNIGVSLVFYNIILYYYFYNNTDRMSSPEEVQVCWQGMYMQLALQYSALSLQYHNVTERNNSLYQQLERLMNEKIQLMQEDIPTQPSIPSPYPLDKNRNSQEITITKKTPALQHTNTKINKNYRRHRIRRDESVYHCTYPDCQKVYHSSVSMNLHIKLKHNGGTKKEREAYAKLLLDSRQKGLEVPDITLNLPPNFLSEFKQNYQYIKKYNM